MYIPAFPLTPLNQAYVEKQKENFLTGSKTSDFLDGKSEADFVGFATVEDIVSVEGKRAMGFA